MGSKEELNKRVRETIFGLSDEDLANMQKASASNYTPFARQVLEEEVSRRKRMKAITKGTPQAGSADHATLLNRAGSHSNADCYIEVWSEKDFEGEHLKIQGPVESPSLEFADLKWADSISSLRVGPCAFVLVYAEREFKGTMMTFGPGQEVSNLEDLKFDDQIDSIRLVNSIKVFDGFRVDDAGKPAGERPPETKRNKGRRKIRRGKPEL